MDNNITNDVNDAVGTGISGEAVADTINEMTNKEGKIPQQYKDAVEAVAEMKSDKPDQFNPEYASNLVQNNSNRIKEALKDGIEPAEIATEIAKTSVTANTNQGMKKLNFITKLISKMKRKERKKNLEKQQAQQVQQIQQEQLQKAEQQQELGEMQKVYTYTNNNQNNG